MTRLLVTGSTGTYGRRLVHTLTAQGHRPEVLVRQPGNPGHLRSALAGVDRLFLVSPNVPEQIAYEKAVIDAAAAVGVSRIVKISAHGAAADSPVAFWRWHAEIERHLVRSRIRSVAVRPLFSMANLLGHAAGIRDHGVVFTPHLAAPIAMVDPQDVAEVAAQLLTADDLPERPYLDVSGPVGVTFDDLAAELTELTGRTISYRGGTDEQTMAYLEQRNTPPFLAEQLLAIFGVLRTGAQAAATTTVPELLGRQARPLTPFLVEHAAVFRAPVGASVTY